MFSENLQARSTSRSLFSARGLVVAGLLTLLVAVPAQAKFNWLAALAVTSTVVGVGVGVSGNPAVGVALIGLQGSLLTSGAATEGTGAAVISDDLDVGFFDAPGPVTTEPARAALIREYPMLELTGDPEVDYFLQATNEVFESVNVLARSRQEGAPVEQLAADLRDFGLALERAAEEYDRMGLDHQVSRADVEGFQQEVSTVGLPPAEEQFLTTLGFDEEEKEAFAQLVSTAPVNLNRSVTPGEILHAAADLIAAVD